MHVLAGIMYIIHNSFEQLNDYILRDASILDLKAYKLNHGYIRHRCIAYSSFFTLRRSALAPLD